MQGFRLGSIFGFEIRVDLSWFIIFFLILWTLTVNIFPYDFPGLSNSTYILMGIAGTLLFFISLILHELSHSLVAQTKGIPVEGITLFAFGGVSHTRMDAETPGDEFQIAVVGPLTSLLLAAFFSLLWWIGSNAGWSVAITGVAAYLSSINVILAGFNLLPGFPLDGGRLFRSIVWKVTGNLTKATRLATTGGRVLGYLLIGLGIWQVFGTNLLGGLWFILIGWFLNNAAEFSYQELILRKGLAGLHAQQLMTPRPETVPSNLKLQEFVDEYLLKRHYQAFPVTQDGHPIGIITLNQVKDVPRQEWTQHTVEETMTPTQPGITARPEEDMSQVLQKMQESGSSRVLVTSNGKLEGIITASDIANWLQRRQDLGMQEG
jgi:Zn-dependent protease/CBS domain-containing protein